MKEPQAQADALMEMVQRLDRLIVQQSVLLQIWQRKRGVTILRLQPLLPWPKP